MFDHGGPLCNVNVGLSRYASGKLEPTAVARTDDLGQFRLFDVLPGTYYLSATYLSFRIPGSATQSSYPSTFYPGVLDFQDSTKIEVGASSVTGGWT